MNVQPDFPNPYRVARQMLRMTHEELASKVGHSKLYVIRTEQGVYPSPSAKLTHFFLSAIEDDDFDFEHFTARYRTYQAECRKANGPLNMVPVLNPHTHLVRRAYKEHPFRYWMAMSHVDLSLMVICKAYCISPSLLHRWVTQSHVVLTVPDPIREALLEAGYSTELMDQLAITYEAYRTEMYSLPATPLPATPLPATPTPLREQSVDVPVKLSDWRV